MQSSTFPQLSSKGSWADEATYSHADVASIIEYARVRAVRERPGLEALLRLGIHTDLLRQTAAGLRLPGRLGCGSTRASRADAGR